MESQEMKDLTLKALEQYKGDNLPRARHAFKNYSEATLNAPYGQSDITPRQNNT